MVNGVIYIKNKVTIVLKDSDFNTFKDMPEFQKLPYTPEAAQYYLYNERGKLNKSIAKPQV